MSNPVRIRTSGQIYEQTAWLVRRVAAVWLALWMGMVVAVTVVTPVSFHSVPGVVSAPPAGYAKLLERVPQPALRELLVYQVAEANRAMLELWTWIQLAIAVSLFLMLLLLSTAGRLQLGVSAVLVADAAVLKLVLVAKLGESALQVVSPDAVLHLAHSNGQFLIARTAFLISQALTLLGGAFLLILLLRGSRGARRADSI